MGDTLTCISGTEFTLRKLEAIGIELVEQELATATGGNVTKLRIQVFQPERHAKATI